MYNLFYNIFYLLPEFNTFFFLLYIFYCKFFNYNIIIILLFILLFIFLKNYFLLSNLIFLNLFFINFYKYLLNNNLIFHYNLIKLIIMLILIITIFIFFLILFFFFKKKIKFILFSKKLFKINLILLLVIFNLKICKINYLNFKHLPISNLYEALIIFKIILNFLFLFIEIKYNILFLYFLLNFLNFIILLIIINLFSKSSILNISIVSNLNNLLIKFHVPIIFLSYSGFIISSFLTVLIFFKKYLFNNLIYIIKIKKLIYKFFIFSFLNFSLGNLIGSIWAKKAWGFYWNWDAKEIWSLILWINYLFWLHFYIIKNKFDFVLLFWNFINLFFLFFLFFGVNFFSKSLHSYIKF